MNRKEQLITDGYPKKIIGHDGLVATLIDIQILFNGEYVAIYRYPGGNVIHDLDDIKLFQQINKKNKK